MLKPLLIACLWLLTGPALAQSWKVGVADSGEYHYAAVPNESDAVFGQFCYPAAGHCIWILMNRTGCEDESTSPGLASSDAGAFHVTLVCRGKHVYQGVTYYRHVVSGFDDVDQVVRGGGTVGFAFPLASGQFRVARFDTDRAGVLIDRMRDRAEKARSRLPASTTKDVTL